MKPFTAFLYIILVLPMFGHAQAGTAPVDTILRSAREYRQTSIALLAGYNYYGCSSAEIGLTKKVDYNSGRHPVWSGINASCEVFNKHSWYIGPKLGAWLTGGLGLGCNLIYYSNFRQSSLQFRPEIGGGISQFFFFYGRNMRITNTGFNLVSKNMVGINLFFDVRKYPPKTSQRG